MTLKESPLSNNDSNYRDIPGADILDECDTTRKRSKSRRKPAAARKALYVPTPKEAAAAGRMLERRKVSKPRIDFSVDHTAGGNNISEVHPDKVIAQISLADTFATANTHFSEALLLQLAGISSAPGTTDISAARLAQSVAMVQGIGPRDEVEAMLATQMVAIHNAVMQSASSMQLVGNLEAKEAFAGMAQKLAKTFTAQIEALKIHRSTGEQHIHVHRHGFPRKQDQAGGCKKSTHQSHEPKPADDPIERSSPLLRKIEAIAAAVPSPGAKG